MIEDENADSHVLLRVLTVRHGCVCHLISRFVDFIVSLTLKAVKIASSVLGVRLIFNFT